MPETSVARTYVGMPSRGNFYERLLGDADRIVAESSDIPVTVDIHLAPEAAGFFSGRNGHVQAFENAGMGMLRAAGKRTGRSYRITRFELRHSRNQPLKALTFYLTKA